MIMDRVEGFWRFVDNNENNIINIGVHYGVS